MITLMVILIIKLKKANKEIKKLSIKLFGLDQKCRSAMSTYELYKELYYKSVEEMHFWTGICQLKCSKEEFSVLCDTRDKIMREYCENNGFEYP